MDNKADSTPRHDSNQKVNGEPSKAVPSTDAMAPARMISPHTSAAQVLKLEDAANAFTLNEYQRAIKWAQSGANDWWATKVSVGMVAKQYHKLMDDYKAANPEARADDQVIAELTKPKYQRGERKTDERMCSHCGAEGLVGREFESTPSPDGQACNTKDRCKSCGKDSGLQSFRLSEKINLSTGEVTIEPHYVFNLGRLVMPKAKAAKERTA